MRRRAALAAAALPLFPALAASHDERCAKTSAEAGALLGRPHIARAWREVTMKDGKPLTMRITGEGAALHMAFIKAGEGLWAEGPVHLCWRVARVVAGISRSELTLGPAAGWAVRQLFAGGATFELAIRDNGHLRVATLGWSGEFEVLLD